jgi:hypothetical protein
MRQLLSAALLGALELTFTACNSGHLTRSRAKAQLDALSKKAASSDDSGPHPILFQIGTISGACTEGLTKDYDPVESGAEYPVLLSTGYITMQPIKNHVWRIELSERGKKSIAGEPYAHKQNGDDCDQWQVSMPLAKYDHLDITGILEEGAHAKVDIAITFAITQAGMDARKVAEQYVFEVDKRKYGEKLAHDFLSNSLTSLLGDDVAYAPPSARAYVKRGSVTFNKYDDGWKIDESSAKEEK